MDQKHLRDILRRIHRVVPRKIYVTKLDAGLFGMQHRERYFFTTFPVDVPKAKPGVTWNSVLDPIGTRFEVISDQALRVYNMLIKKSRSNGTTLRAVRTGKTWKFIRVKSPYKSRWEFASQWHCTLKSRARTITRSNRSLLILEYRKGLVIRWLTVHELERLFGFPKGYVGKMSKSRALDLLGNSIDVNCSRHVVKFIK